MAIVTADVVCRHWQPREGILHHADHIQLCQRGFHHQHVRAFFHITPNVSNAELVGQLDPAITDHEYPPTVWADGEVVQEQVQISAAKLQPGSYAVWMGMNAPVTKLRAAVEAGHDRLGHDAGVDAEPIPELEFDQTLGWQTCALEVAHAAERGLVWIGHWRGAASGVVCQIRIAGSVQFSPVMQIKFLRAPHKSGL